MRIEFIISTKVDNAHVMIIFERNPVLPFSTCSNFNKKKLIIKISQEYRRLVVYNASRNILNGEEWIYMCSKGRTLVLIKDFLFSHLLILLNTQLKTHIMQIKR